MFAIGDDQWPGLSKLAEESGEVLQLVGKIMGARGATLHWDGQNLRERLLEELADLSAAIAFVVGNNGLNARLFEERAQRKLALFQRWHKDNPPLPSQPTLTVTVAQAATVSPPTPTTANCGVCLDGRAPNPVICPLCERWTCLACGKLVPEERKDVSSG